MSHETVNGLRYAIEEAGAGEPLLLLHGFTGSRATWRDLWPQLATRFRVLAIDLPGHGGSDAPVDPARYTIFRVAADLVEILKRRAARPAHWLGYSMGAVWPSMPHCTIRGPSARCCWKAPRPAWPRHPSASSVAPPMSLSPYVSNAMAWPVL